MAATDAAFAGSIPALYDLYLGPLLFQPYAEEVARRARTYLPGHVLETAAGTGVVTAALHQALPEANIIATDLNPAMLEVAAERVASDKVNFEPADAQDLRFADETFDLVVCQFGLMFYPDKVKGNSEARRVLRDDGCYLVVVWDRLDRNPVSQAVSDAVARVFPDDPPRFLPRTPFGYSDPDEILADLRSAGFAEIDIETVERSSRVNALSAAKGMCCGSPLAAEILERDPQGLDRAVEAAAEALRRFDGEEVGMSALLVTAMR